MLKVHCLGVDSPSQSVDYRNTLLTKRARLAESYFNSYTTFWDLVFVGWSRMAIRYLEVLISLVLEVNLLNGAVDGPFVSLLGLYAESWPWLKGQKALVNDRTSCLDIWCLCTSTRYSGLWGVKGLAQLEVMYTIYNLLELTMEIYNQTRKWLCSREEKTLRRLWC